MMELVTGDLLQMAEEGKFDVIVQGCNCFCTMGSGIARSIREKWPAVYLADLDTDKGDYNKLGSYSAYTQWMGTSSVNTCVIINAYTQYGFNKAGEEKDVFEYLSFALILQKLAYRYPGKKFGFPMIGMGLGGGDTNRIMAMLDSFSATVEATGGSVTVVKFH